MTLTVSRRGASTVATVLASIVLLGACSPPSKPLPPSPPVVTITMDEWKFEHPAELPRGRVVFRVVNAGTGVHRVTLAPLHKDYPPVAEQLKSEERRVISTVAAIAAQSPGASTSFAVDLGPQRYGLFCLIIEKNGTDHARKGMASEFRVK